MFINGFKPSVMKRIILPVNHSAYGTFNLQLSASICGLNRFFCFLCLFVTIPLHAAPRIECENTKYDFGTVIGQEPITHEFILWNRGDESLEIVKIKDCCGVKSSAESMTISPGSNVVCTSVFNTSNRYGKQDKQILLVTSDKKHPYVDLRMTGTLLKPVEFMPRWIRLSDLMPDSVISESIVASNLLEQAVTLESVSSTVPGLAAELVEENTDRISAPRRSWTILLTTTGPLSVGGINGQVQLHFSTGTVTVPVTGEVKPVVEATPDQIRISSRAPEHVHRVLMLRSGDGRPFDVLSSVLENAEGAVAAKKLADGNWQVSLTVQPSTIKSTSCICIQTSLESPNTVVIPLSCSGR